MITEEKLLKLRKLADAMYYAAQQLTTDASRLHKAMDEYHKFIIHEYKEEPVSENLMTISKEWFEHCKKSWYNEGYVDGEYNRDRQFEDSVSEDLEEFINTIKRLTSNTALLTFEYGCREGANWQKQKDKFILRELYDISNQQDGCLALETLQLMLSEKIEED